MNYTLRASGITKKFNGKTVISGIDLDIAAGSTIGIIGKNGAGKTTFIKMALGFLRPSSGNITVFDEIPGRFPGRVGYLSERSEYHICFTGFEYLKHIASISDPHKKNLNSYVNELIDLVGLTDSGGKKMARYSKGMLQRLGIAQALITSPDFLILDEPFSGLDPSGQKELCDLILNLKTTKKTILICSHILAHLEKICENVALLHKGQIIRHERMTSILVSENNFTLELSEIKHDFLEKLKKHFNISDTGKNKYIYKERSSGEKEILLKEILNNGLAVNEFAPLKQTLDDYFNHVIAGKDGD